jgi:hypothetical protein
LLTDNFDFETKIKKTFGVKVGMKELSMRNNREEKFYMRKLQFGDTNIVVTVLAHEKKVQVNYCYRK